MNCSCSDLASHTASWPFSPLQRREDLKALNCLRCGRQFTQKNLGELLRHAQWDHGLSIYQTEPESPEAPLLGLAEVAVAVSAVSSVVGPEAEVKGLPGGVHPAEPPARV